MASRLEQQVDVLIFGGGIAGLWLLDELHRRSHRALLVECHSLGTGQTIASQGIIHGGLKYMLGGLVSGSAESISDLPHWWRDCLEGERQPDLRAVAVASPCCYLWRTESLSSWAAMSVARFALQTPLQKVPPADRPDVLGRCPGDVYRIEEQVIDSASLLSSFLHAHKSRVVKNADDEIAFRYGTAGCVDAVRLTRPDDRRSVEIRCGTVVFAAGEGNERLRRQAGLPANAMQRRPLHMVMARGPLPMLFGHCIDGNRTRVTVTSTVDSMGRVVWQVGGELAESGVALNADQQIAKAWSDLEAVFPGMDFSGVEWASYRVDRAEGMTADGRRPDGPVLRKEGNVLTVWPTKLVLAPRLATMAADLIGDPHPASEGLDSFDDWPRPFIAKPPWELVREWRKR